MVTFRELRKSFFNYVRCCWCPLGSTLSFLTTWFLIFLLFPSPKMNGGSGSWVILHHTTRLEIFKQKKWYRQPSALLSKRFSVKRNTNNFCSLQTNLGNIDVTLIVNTITYMRWETKRKLGEPRLYASGNRIARQILFSIRASAAPFCFWR